MLDKPETDTRARIVAQAEEYFRLYGYQKTTVADIAKALRMSPANVYRFFESKKAINEAVAEVLMGEVEAAAGAIASGSGPAADRLREFLKTVSATSAERYIGDRKMHEMVAVALEESWSIVHAHVERLHGMLYGIIADGVATGEFDVPDPALAARCVHAAVIKFTHPQMIAECAAENLKPELDAMTDFLLRALRKR
jgi:AcrR family transcriptional regulator